MQMQPPRASRVRGGSSVPDGRTQQSTPLLVAARPEDPEILAGELELLRGEVQAMRDEAEANEALIERLRAAALRIVHARTVEERTAIYEELIHVA